MIKEISEIMLAYNFETSSKNLDIKSKNKILRYLSGKKCHGITSYIPRKLPLRKISYISRCRVWFAV